MNEKKKRINITLSEGVLLSIDSHARIKGMSRSGYITFLEQMENYRTQKFIQDNSTDYYMDLPLDSPYLKAVLGE